MKTFKQWLEAKDNCLTYPADCCPRKIVSRACKSGYCDVESGTNHDRIVKQPEGSVVTTIPRHNRLNPNTCRSIIRSVEKNC